MRQSTRILIARAKNGVDMAIVELELAEAQITSAMGLETLGAVVDMPSDFKQTLVTLRRQSGELETLLGTSLPSIQ